LPTKVWQLKRGTRFTSSTTGERDPRTTSAQIGAIVGRVAPRDGEPVIVKSFPNSFVQTGPQAGIPIDAKAMVAFY
jgi:hypothetical protein